MRGAKEVHDTERVLTAFTDYLSAVVKGAWNVPPKKMEDLRVAIVQAVIDEVSTQNT